MTLVTPFFKIFFIFSQPVENIIDTELFCLTTWDIMIVLSYNVIDSKGSWFAVQGAKTMKVKTYTIGLRKPSLGARVLHLAINNRAWLKAAMSKRIAYGGKKNG